MSIIAQPCSCRMACGIQCNLPVLSHLSLGHDPDPESLPRRLVPEERISFGINPAISTLTTVAQIREDYNEVDCRLIAKEVWSDLC